MSEENNEAVIATTWSKSEAQRIAEYIKNVAENPGQYSEVESLINRKFTFILSPDGSKKGWPHAVAGEQERQLFIREIERGNFEDGSSPWDWVEVGYGEYGQDILQGNCKNQYTPAKQAPAPAEAQTDRQRIDQALKILSDVFDNAGGSNLYPWLEKHYRPMQHDRFVLGYGPEERADG